MNDFVNDPVQEFLLNTGCPEHVVNGGLVGLVTNWEKVVASVANGYELTLDDYLNDLDARQLLELAFRVAPHLEQIKLQPRVAAADDHMKSATSLVAQCLWGDEVAAEENWSPEKNWWYYSVPNKVSEEFLEELG